MQALRHTGRQAKALGTVTARGPVAFPLSSAHSDVRRWNRSKPWRFSRIGEAGHPWIVVVHGRLSRVWLAHGHLRPSFSASSYKEIACPSQIQEPSSLSRHRYMCVCRYPQGPRCLLCLVAFMSLPDTGVGRLQVSGQDVRVMFRCNHFFPNNVRWVRSRRIGAFRYQIRSWCSPYYLTATGMVDEGLDGHSYCIPEP